MNPETIETDKLWATPIWRTKIKVVNNEALIQFVLDELFCFIIKTPQKKFHYPLTNFPQKLFRFLISLRTCSNFFT